MSMLERYGTNLTKLAKDGKLDPFVGRDSQIDSVIEILMKHGTKRNVCLTGEPGVGKMAVVRGLAQRIAAGDVPKDIAGKQVITLEFEVLRAENRSTFDGKFEERLKKLLAEIKQAGDIIIVINEFHTHITPNPTYTLTAVAANLLKPALARAELQCIGATTLTGYKREIENDPALNRQFQRVPVPEPTVDETILILKGWRKRYESHHSLRYTVDALEAATKLSKQYISDRLLPEKAIDLIDAAGSRVRLRHGQVLKQARDLEQKRNGNTEEKIEAGGSSPTVTEADIRQVVSAWTGIPVEKIPVEKKDSSDGEEVFTDGEEVSTDGEEVSTDEKEVSTDEKEVSTDEKEVSTDREEVSTDREKVSADESDRLLKIEETLHERVIGQDEAVNAISRAIRRGRVGLRNPNRPIASFIFCGPTGVGKSELAKAVASSYSGSKEAMVRLDMSEFMERHSVSKLIGAPPGYVGYHEGGQLTGPVRRRPNTVVLFDEIEKAHPDVFNILLQVMDDGRLTDSSGNTADFKMTLLIMTSNVGSRVIEKGGDYHMIKSLVNKELKSYFKPEFLNRLDEIIVFRQLTKPEVKKIADIMLKEVVERLKKKKIDLQMTQEFKDRVVDEGYCPSYGARPLRRAIMRLLEDNMAERILSGEISEGNSAVIDVDSKGTVTVTKNP